MQSRGLLRMARSRKILLLVSQVLIDELKLAPQVVQDELKQLPAWATEMLPVTPEVVDLRDAYLGMLLAATILTMLCM